MDKYLQTTSELFDLQKFAVKLGLENITALASHFNNPHLTYPSIHIAGTNGKGSTAFYISKLLEICGLNVGLFTSPHLIDFRERIRVNSKLIDKEYVKHFWDDIKSKVFDLKATFFDTTTLMAFKYFADHNVDIAIFETGLGGRLDSTNILQSQFAVLTPVSFDHQKQLGNNLTSISKEKAGIIKQNSKIFSSVQHSNTLKVFRSYSKSSDFYYLPENYSVTILNWTLKGISFKLSSKKKQQDWFFTLPTFASYQVENFALAFFVTKEYCKTMQIDFPTKKISVLMEKINWPGRLQMISKYPNIIFDVSHNLSGIKKTILALSRLIDMQRTHLLLGIVNDKDANSIVHFLSGKFKSVIVTEPDTNRKQDGELLERLFRKHRQKVKFIKELSGAYELSSNNLENNENLLVLGSHYLIGALMRIG